MFRKIKSDKYFIIILSINYLSDKRWIVNLCFTLLLYKIFYYAENFQFFNFWITGLSIANIFIILHIAISRFINYYKIKFI